MLEDRPNLNFGSQFCEAFIFGQDGSLRFHPYQIVNALIPEHFFSSLIMSFILLLEYGKLGLNDTINVFQGFGEERNNANTCQVGYL